MPLPTLNQLITQLHRYKAKDTAATIKQELLTRLELLDKDNVDDFTVYLCDLLKNEAIKKEMKKILYNTSVILGHHYPRNQLKSGRVEDPILFDYIDPKHLFISQDRYQWSIVNLVDYFMTKNKYQNPVTGTLFTQLDIEKMKTIARKSGLTVRLQSEPTVPNNHSRRFDSTAMGHRLYSLFGFTQTTTASGQHTLTAVAVPFAGGIVVYRG